MGIAHNDPAPKQRRRDTPPTEPPPPPARIDDIPQLAGWRWYSRLLGPDTFEHALIAPDGWETKRYQKPTKAIAEALRRVRSQPRPKDTPMTTTETDAPLTRAEIAALEARGWRHAGGGKHDDGTAYLSFRAPGSPKNSEPVQYPREAWRSLLALPDLFGLPGWQWELEDGQARLTNPGEGYATAWGPMGPDADYEGRITEARKRVAADLALAEEEPPIRRGAGVKLSTTAISPDDWRELPPGEIRRDGGTQARMGNNEEVVEAYTVEMREGRWRWHEGNRLVVFFDGADHWLADGFHRTEAAQRADLLSVPVEVHEGSRRDAVLYAVGANADHGLRRTRDDVRRAIRTLLLDDEWRSWSNAEIARRARTTDKTVAVVRSELESTSEIPRLDERVGADGKVRAVNPPTPATSAPARPHPSCARCGLPGAVLIGKHCQGCYLLQQAQEHPDGSDEALWRYRTAGEDAERDPDVERRARRLTEVNGLAQQAGFVIGPDGLPTMPAPPRPAPGVSQCFDCGTTEDLVEVGGPVKVLCRYDMAKRGNRLTDGLSEAAVAAGYTYRHSGGSVAIEQGGQFRRWLHGEPTKESRDPRAAWAAFQQRAIAAIEALIAPAPETEPVLPADDRGIAPETPAKLIPRDWDAWRARAAAAGGTLILAADGLATFTLAGGAIYAARKVSEWAGLTGSIAIREMAVARKAAAPEQAIRNALMQLDTDTASRLAAADPALLTTWAADIQTTDEIAAARRDGASVDPLLARVRDGQLRATLAQLSPTGLAALDAALGEDVPAGPVPAVADAPALAPAGDDGAYAAAEPILARILARLSPAERAVLAAVTLPVDDLDLGALDDPGEALWEHWTFVAGDRLAYLAEALEAPAQAAPPEPWPESDHPDLDALSSALMGAELSSDPPDAGQVAAWQDTLDACASEISDETYERLAHRIGELRRRAKEA